MAFDQCHKTHKTSVVSHVGLSLTVKNPETAAGPGALAPCPVLQVIASRNPEWRVGELFGAHLPFTTVQVLSAERLAKSLVWRLTGLLTEETISLGIGVLGMPGSTAYGGPRPRPRPRPRGNPL